MSERKVPKIRFPGFTGEWVEKKLGEVLSVETIRNGSTFSKEDVLSVSDEYGCVNQIRFQGRSFAGEDISNYKIVQTGDIVYTRSPLKAKPFGIIKIVREETGIVSPLYIVNQVKVSNDPEFLYRVFDSSAKTNNYLSPLVRKGAKNTMNISEEEWLSGKINVSDSFEEQKSIGDFFKRLDESITQIQTELTKWKELKKSMLQKMFPKEGESVPEIRFPGFTDPWEQRKVGELSKRVIVGLATSVTPYYRQEGIPILRNLNIKENYLDDTDILFLERAYAESQVSKQIHTGDVLTVHTGYIGTSCIVPAKYDNCLTFTTLITTTDDSILHGEFLAQYLNSEIGISAVQAVTTQGGRQNLNTNDFIKVEIRYPSLAEQEAICSMLRNIDTLITLHQRECDKWQTLKKALLQQMFV